MFKILFLCGALCAALEAQPHKAHDGSNLSAAQQRNIEKLKTDLEAIKGKSQVRIAQLTNDFYNAAVGDTQTLLKASGVRSADATLIASDLKAIGAEVQKNAQSAQPGDIRKKLGRN